MIILDTNVVSEPMKLHGNPAAQAKVVDVGYLAVSVADGQIAAIASAHRFSVATRDTVPFTAVGVLVIDPWET